MPFRYIKYPRKTFRALHSFDAIQFPPPLRPLVVGLLPESRFSLESAFGYLTGRFAVRDGYAFDGGLKSLETTAELRTEVVLRDIIERFVARSFSWSCGSCWGP